MSFSYQESIDYLYSLPRYGKTSTLERMKNFLTLLENPQKKYPSIVVTGTNGKGSLSALCHSLLLAGGFSVGLFTSPHLIKVNERFRIGQKILSNDELASFTNQLRPALQKLHSRSIYPSGFEAFTALAHLVFEKKQVDLAILEVGIGGKLDPTTLSKAIVTAITHVDLEHTHLLGNSKTQIAREKMGILRANVPLFSAETDPQIQDLMKKKCEELKIPFFRLGKEISYEIISSNLQGQTFHISTPFRSHKNLFCPLLGNFQLNNIALAVSIIDYLSFHSHFFLTPDQIHQGLSSVWWPARLECLSTNPLVLVDSAHNISGVKTLVNAIQSLCPSKKIILLIGISEDKPYQKMLSIFSSLTDHAIFSEASYRATPASKLAEVSHTQKIFPKNHIEPCLENAMTLALKYLSHHEILLVGGGLFFASEVREKFLKSNP